MGTFTVTVPTLVGFVPPTGYRIKQSRQLEDGTFEVLLEPVGFLS